MNTDNNTTQAQQPLSILLPPPNITGKLHLGHAFQQVLMDILAKYHTMQQRQVIWHPGTDHAGIAGQMMIEKQIQKDGLDKFALSSSALNQYGHNLHLSASGFIKYQMQRLGLSVDWERERFTMDAHYQEAVTESFVRMYQAGLLYRSDKLVYYDPHFKTVLSDLEVVYKERQASLWFISYPLTHAAGVVTVATTRPETIFGDVALLVHPYDVRYTALVGQKVMVPILNKMIPIIADDCVDRDFGTGCVKVTPGHDFQDYAVAERHNLEKISIFNPDLTLNKQAPQRYVGLNIHQARMLLLEELRHQGALEKEVTIQHRVPVGDRSNVVLEAIMTKQWFLKAKKLVPAVLHAVAAGELSFYPANWENNFQLWAQDITDWCISRQIWWGHKIPAWYDAHDNLYVGRNEAEARAQCPESQLPLTRDPDVLDTWFASALWPLATQGWPHAHALHPHTYLITGFDILFFWVMRMAMFSKFFLNIVPARKILITGLIRDVEGQKMSKTLGNVIDPLDILDGISLENLLEKQLQALPSHVDKETVRKKLRRNYPQGIAAYGPDVLRLTFAQLSTPSVTASFDLSKLKGSEAFKNKLVNATRFVTNYTLGYQHQELAPIRPLNIWIINKLAEAARLYETHINNLRFDLAVKTIQEFFLADYCGWFIEFAKITLQHLRSKSPKLLKQLQLQEIQRTLLLTLYEVVKLLHPVMPFITQNIFHSLRTLLKLDTKNLIAEHIVPLTVIVKHNEDPNVELLCATITALRSLRSQYQDEAIHLVVPQINQLKFFKQHQELLTQISKVSTITLHPQLQDNYSVITQIQTLSICLLTTAIRLTIKTQARSDIPKLLRKKAWLQAQLASPQFMLKAPQAIIAQYEQELSVLERTLELAATTKTAT